MYGAALPAGAQDVGDRRRQTGVRVADGQLHPRQPAGDQAAQEVGPERLGLRFADVQGENLAAAGLVDPMGDDQRFGDDAATAIVSGATVSSCCARQHA
jgi:hypothetical protein